MPEWTRLLVSQPLRWGPWPRAAPRAVLRHVPRQGRLLPRGAQSSPPRQRQRVMFRLFRRQSCCSQEFGARQLRDRDGVVDGDGRRGRGEMACIIITNGISAACM